MTDLLRPGDVTRRRSERRTRAPQTDRADTEPTARQRTFAELLRSHRISRGATQRQLADLSTVSVRAIRDLELGRVSRPRSDTVRLIVEGLGLVGRERADLELAARRLSPDGALRVIYNAEPAAPPAPLGEMIGRDGELAVVGELLATGSQRLVTVTGISGVGKTALALRVAGTLHDTAGLPVLWSAAADRPEADRSTEPSRRLDALVRSGLVRSEVDTEAGPTEATLTEPAELADLIGERPTLVVLDGYDPTRLRADRLVDLLRHCRGLRVLCTAQAPLGIHGERVFPLAPLPVPHPSRPYNLAALARVPAVRMLVRRAREARPEFELDASNAAAVAALCARLDGVPGVLDAVASWFLVDEPAALLSYGERFSFELATEALPDLRDSLERTVASLSPDEAAVLDRLADATPGWSMHEAVGLSRVSPVLCARLVHRLLLLGLIRPAEETDRARFQVLDLVRVLRTDSRLAAYSQAEAV